MRRDLSLKVQLVTSFAMSCALKNAYHDWHKWTLSFVSFMCATWERDPKESVLLDFSLREMDAMNYQPGDKYYLSDCQLLVGSIHALRGDYDKAKRAMALFREGQEGRYTIEDEMSACPFDDRVRGSQATKNMERWRNAAGTA